MVNEGNQIHNFISCYGKGTVINYGYGSGSGSTNKEVPVPTVPIPVPVPQHYFVGVLKVTNKKRRIRSWIRIRLSEVRIRGSGSVLKCHGSGALPAVLKL
jgi:hypothetical protein